MSTAYVVVAALAVLANAGIAVADLVKADFVLANSAAVRVPPSWLPVLGAVKGAGAVGLLLGLLGVPVVGTAAAIGLVAFFVGALAAHARAGVWHNIAVPAAFLALPATALALDLAR
ncbi:DoxX-like protein [Saccharothrix saharensis]|uniref:DoxX-like protein n=1 Tax=Saccharothrix saharensis TaxID=571190 RepID=A0A543JJU4_9PSEU|nr:DoxX family protein [Saccharothrix saharensis]TQM83093.1 DoxX-like protein [Saccharothrix saharensis]